MGTEIASVVCFFLYSLFREGARDGSVGYKRHMTNEEREERIAGDERLTMIGLF